MVLVSKVEETPKMNVVIDDICNAIQSLVNNYHSDGKSEKFDWIASNVAHADVFREFGKVFDDIIARNNATLIKAFHGPCLLLICVSGLCVRVGFCFHWTGEVRVFVDCSGKPENYVEYYWSDGGYSSDDCEESDAD